MDWSVQGNKRIGSRGNSLTQNLEVSTLEYRQARHLPWLRCFIISSVPPSEFREIIYNTPSYYLLNSFEPPQARSCLSICSASHCD
jgi:hypothetical protein